MAQQETRYQRNPDYIFRRIVDELVLVPIHKDVADMDCIYTLNGVAAFVWEQLENPACQSNLLSAVLDEYDGDPQAVAADLAGFLQEMESYGAVKRV